MAAESLRGKVGFDTIREYLQDPMVSDHYALRIPSPPVKMNGIDVSRPLRVLVQELDHPGLTINEVEVQLFGHTLVYTGNITYSHDMTITYAAPSRGELTVLFMKWMNLCRGQKTQHGQYHRGQDGNSGYAADAYIDILDQMGFTVLSSKIVDIWPNTLPEFTMTGTGAELITHAVGFKYNEFEEVGGTAIDNYGAIDTTGGINSAGSYTNIIGGGNSVVTA